MGDDAQHARLAPSAAVRWINCPGSVALAADIPRTTSPEAEEGTAAHELAAKALGEGNEPQDYIGGWFNGYEVTQEMADFVQVYTDTVRGEPQDHAWIEERYDASEFVPEVWGTADATTYDETSGVLSVIDLKYGCGVPVSAEDNPQLKLYALGAYSRLNLLYDIDTIKMVIVQPRVSSQPSEQELSVSELLDWADTAATSARSALAAADNTEMFPRELLIPGAVQCRFCPAKAVCPALAEQTAQTVYGELFDMSNISEARTPKSIEGLSVDQLAEVLARVDQIEGWCKAVREHAQGRLAAGDKIPGFKLVAGRRGQRKWSDPDKAEKVLREQFRLKKEDVYKMTLVSPAQAEKLQLGPRRWEKLSELITQSEGNPTIAPATDNRQAINPTATIEDFNQ